MADNEDIFEQYPPGGWTVDSDDGSGPVTVFFGITAITEQYSARVVRKTRMYKDGERLDNTGSNARSWQVMCEFYNGGSDPVARGNYPDDANELGDVLRVARTGDLVLPTVGSKRAMVESYTRVEMSTDRDFCSYQVTWVEDSEDDERVASFKAPPASSVSAKYVSDYTEFAAKDAAVEGDPFGEIETLANDLSKLASTPERYASSWESRVSQVNNAIDRVERAYGRAATQASGRVVSLLNGPEASRTIRRSRTLRDTFSASTTTSSVFRYKRYTKPVSIFDVATDLAQDVDRLIALNSNVPDLLVIPTNTPIRYYAGAP